LFIYDGYIGSFISLCLYMFMYMYMYIYYTPNWFISSIIFLSTLVSPFWWFQRV
jgi:hypothetical protein